ncbi:MAG: RNA polymerase sigma-54 factor, partial [Deltaproteobacteria bacterium]|nr:RNA polymerase sigma-54 factor [Deltaproteobacteria bacterium]
MAALQLKQSLKLAQQLIMTPQLQQAIKLLQLSRLELMDTIHQELEENPLLEEVPLEDGPSEAETPPDEALLAKAEAKLDRDRTSPVEVQEQVR